MAYTKTTWANSPATTSPLSAANLDKIENGIYDNRNKIINIDNITKFITATAGSNGDFYVNIDNTLETNMIINIVFPAATNAASNARLSIDNGTTYKNIKDYNSNQLLASYFQNKGYSLYYNGTDFIPFLSKDLLLLQDAGKSMTLYKTSAQNVAATTAEEITYQGVVAGYDPNIFEVSGNGIKIKRACNAILCTTSFRLTAGAETAITTYIFKNGSNAGATYNSNQANILFSKVLTNIAANDIITSYIYLSSTNTIADGGADWEYLIVTIL